MAEHRFFVNDTGSLRRPVDLGIAVVGAIIAFASTAAAYDGDGGHALAGQDKKHEQGKRGECRIYRCAGLRIHVVPQRLAQAGRILIAALDLINCGECAHHHLAGCKGRDQSQSNLPIESQRRDHRLDGLPQTTGITL